MKIIRPREWDLFVTITSAYWGKQYYYKQYGSDVVYSRMSGKYMSFDDAIVEFCHIIGDGDDD